MEQNKKFFVEKKGKRTWVVIRQLPQDPQYKLGSHIPGYGKVVAVSAVDSCGFCGEPYDDHRPASGNSAPYCMARNSRPGDTFIREAR
jgi:hypothetical protein